MSTPPPIDETIVARVVRLKGLGLPPWRIAKHMGISGVLVAKSLRQSKRKRKPVAAMLPFAQFVREVVEQVGPVVEEAFERDMEAMRWL